MGRVIVLPKVDGSEGVREYAFEGPFIDFLDKHFADGPKGMTHCTVDGDGNRVEVDDYLNPVGDQTYTIAFAPAGLDPITQGIIIAVAAVTLSLAATFLLLPKAPNAQDDGGTSLYSVTAQANRAKIGAVVPYLAGTVTRTPEYASESYREFDALNREVRYILLCLGLGKQRVDQITIGETNINELPSGVVTWEQFYPDDHASTLGNVEAGTTGLHENVYTSSEVDQVEITRLNKFDGTIEGPITLNAERTRITGSEAIAALDGLPGDRLVIANPTVWAGGYVLTDIGEDFVEFTPALPVGTHTGDVDIRVNTAEDGQGPYIVNPAGTEIDQIGFDIEWPTGAYNAENSTGNFGDITLVYQFRIQEIDDDGNDVGSVRLELFTLVNRDNKPLRKTFNFAVTAGRYKATVRRLDNQAFDSTKVDKNIFSGLRGYAVYDTDAVVYGPVTLLALKIIGSQEFSAAAQQRIFVTTTSILPEYGADPANEVAGGNLVDVMADIYTNANYGARRPESEIDSATFDAFRLAQASRSGFNGVYDTSTTVWDALESVAAVGRAKPYPIANGLSLVVDDAKNRTGLITVDNTLRDSLKVQYNWLLPGANDGVEVKYRDSMTFKEKYALFPVNSVDPQRREVRGLTDDDEAEELAEYFWNQLILRNTEVSLSTERDGMNYKPFDRVGVVVPFMNWGDAAEVMAANGTSLTLSRPAPSGQLTIMFRDQEGGVSDAVTATGDGTKTIVLSATAPIEIVTDGRSVRTLCGFGLTSEFVQDVTILEAAPSGSKTAIKAVNYVEI